VRRKIIKQLLVLVILIQLAPVSAALDTARQAELLYLLKHDCGSCHGMTRRGGLGPPLLPGNLDKRSQLLMIDTILDGRPGTPMPPWRGLLTEQEVRWLVEAMRRGDGL
jgi:cytochrome c55X